MIPLPQSRVTPEMTAWAVTLEHDAAGFPLWCEQTRAFGDLTVTARAEVHTWIGKTGEQRPAGLRGISLYYAGAALARARGCDVSGYQTPPLDWAATKAAGYDFVFVKATEGATNTNQHLAAQWNGAGAAKLLRGAYHFFRTTSTPPNQIHHFREVMAPLATPELPDVLDVEWQSSTKALAALDPKSFGDAVLAALKLLAVRRRPILYTAPGFWQLLGKRPDIEEIADLWSAHYGVSAPGQIGTWPRWAFWQYAPRELVPGVGPDDANLFCGTPDELRDYASSGVLPALGFDTAAGLQHVLNLLGANPRLVEDGQIGPKTVAALRLFQGRNGLQQTGVLDAATCGKVSAKLLTA